LNGVDGAGDLLVEAPASWSALDLVRVPSDGERPDVDRIGPHDAELPLATGGWAAIDRRAARATFHVPHDIPDGDLVHPYLAPAAAVAARWAGREAFHAGAVLLGDGAYGLLGDKEMGKSTTLGWLALHGHTVLVDDLLVLDGDDVLAGPRCIDLRESAAELLGAGDSMGVVGMRERFRLRLGAAPASAPLRGWLILEWGDEVAIEPVRGAERLLALLPHRAVLLAPPAPAALVELSSRPVWRLRRPRDPGSLPEVAERLAALAGA
jgi:hypothetical protein